MFCSFVAYNPPLIIKYNILVHRASCFLGKYDLWEVCLPYVEIEASDTKTTCLCRN